MKSYYTWMIEHYDGDDSPCGDLAEDIRRDKHFPKKCRDVKKLKMYFTSKFLDFDVMKVVKESLKDYKQYIKEN